MIVTLVIVAALFLAFANGANDNFKGFATVWGSATLDYRKALIIATIAALAGSFLSILLADGLVKQRRNHTPPLKGHSFRCPDLFARLQEWGELPWPNDEPADDPWPNGPCRPAAGSGGDRAREMGRVRPRL